jgi:hypothetical protein
MSAPAIIDIKAVRGPQTFDGERVNFEPWIFRLESYFALMGWEGHCDTARAETDPIDSNAFTAQANSTARQIYHILATTCEGNAGTIVF